MGNDISIKALRNRPPDSGFRKCCGTRIYYFLWTR